ncbi:transporter [Shewanella sp. SM32]|uniref:transporter n=1 Tax=Shewanella sp. SM32 TaxID=2912796 RepID=UPI0021D91072|nr:transporter [Shewanella sp. SM32]MCU8072593.1 transporter [Shewanella sp. SM32]
MQTMKLTFVTAGVVLVGSLLLNGCDSGNVNTQTGTPNLTVTTEDGTGDDIKIATAVNTALIADQQLQNLDIQIETRKPPVSGLLSPLNNHYV